MPMTWPLTFSSPPVEAYRARNDVVGDRMFENREMGDDRGSYEKSAKRAPEWKQVQDVQLLIAEKRSCWRGIGEVHWTQMNVEGW
jgi:hypothetical protein